MSIKILDQLVNQKGALKLLYRSKVLPITWLLRDDFLTDLPAGSIDGTDAEPGPGTRLVVDTASAMPISGGLLVNPLITQTNWGDPKIRYDGVIRETGRLLLINLTPTSNPNSGGYFGFVEGPNNNWVDYTGFRIPTYPFIQFADQAGNYISSLTVNEENVFAITLRTSGCFLFQKILSGNWKLLILSSLSNTSPIYPGIFGGAKLQSSYLRIPDVLWSPTPLVSDGFSGSSTDGLGHAEGVAGGVGSGGSGISYAASPTWSVAGGIITNTPNLGSNIVVNGGFDEDDHWIKGVGWAIGGGTANATASDNTEISQTCLTIGAWYKLTVTATVVTSGLIYIKGLHNWLAIMGSPQTVSGTGIAVQTDVAMGGASGGSAFTGSIDNVIVQPLTLSELIRSIDSSQSTDIVAQLLISQMSSTSQAGIAIRLNDPTNPTSGIVAFIDPTSAYVRCYEFLGSTWTQRVAAFKSYTNGDSLQIVADGDSIRVFHITSSNIPTLIGAGTTTILTGNYHGIFSTDPTNQLDDFVVYPRGTGNEYSTLDLYTQE